MGSKAYLKFDKTLKRCESLVKTYEDLKTDGKLKGLQSPSKDIIRGAVVLSVSALDAYVTDVFSEKLVPYLKKHTPDDSMIDLLSTAGLDTREALKLINMERPYRRIRTLINKHYSKYTTQKFNVIDELFLQYRIKKITDNAAKTKKARLKRSVEKLIERRHEIAHNGDYNSHGRINSINEKIIKSRINDLELFVLSMDEIICNRING